MRALPGSTAPTASPPASTFAPFATASRTRSLTSCERGLVDQRADDRVGLVRVAGLQALRLLGEPRAELVRDRALDDELAGRHADLALVHEGAERGRVDGVVEVGVREDDERVEAAELEHDALQVPARRLRELAAGRGRAGEVDPPDGRVLDELVADRRRPRPGACVTMLRTPAGSPASAKISPQSVPPTSGESSDGLSTTVLPSASGAAIERADRMSAAFQGAIAPTTPTGRRRPIASVPGWSDGSTWPSGA